MFMIRRTSPCYIRQVQSSISPNKSQNISVNSEAWLAASAEQNQTVGKERLQHPCSGQLGAALQGQWDRGLHRPGVRPCPSTGRTTWSTVPKLFERPRSEVWNTDLLRT